DRVDVTNLHRQQYKASQVGMLKTDALCANLREIAPYIHIEIHNAFINSENTEKLLFDADIICEAFDKAECKAELVNTVLEKLKDKYLVAASGMAGIGTPNSIKTRRISKYFYLSGDGVSDVENEKCLTAPRVMLCAAHQAAVVLRIIAGEYDV
ncbi:MAG: thiamine biosynthesis protein ThiF, partial [Ruminococcus sp.]